MANQSAKRIAASNARILRRLLIGTTLSNVLFLLFRIALTRRARGWSIWSVYLVSQTFALFLTAQLVGMAARRQDGQGRLVSGGSDLTQAGLVQYMFDVIYITWFATVGSALVSDKVWYTFLLIPAYAVYNLSGFILPMLGLGTGTGANAGNKSIPNQPAGNSAGEPAASKRQAKLAKRAEKGDPRVQKQSR